MVETERAKAARWIAGIKCENGEIIRFDSEGNWVESANGREVEVTNMCGGKYLLTDENGFVAGLTNNLSQALDYLELENIR